MLYKKEINRAPFGKGLGGAFGNVVDTVKATASSAVSGTLKETLNKIKTADELFQYLPSIPGVNISFTQELELFYEVIAENEDIKSLDDIVKYLLDHRSEPEFNEKYGYLIRLAIEGTLGSGVTGLIIEYCIGFAKKSKTVEK